MRLQVKFCLNWTNTVLNRPVRFRKKSTTDLSIASALRRPSSPSSIVAPHSSGAAASHGEAHTLIDMGMVALVETAAAVDAAYENRSNRGRRPNVKRVSPKRGLCGEYDREGKFQKCGLEHASERSTLFCQQCKRYYHLPCFQSAQVCYKIR
jgi:hypothetical protein